MRRTRAAPAVDTRISHHPQALRAIHRYEGATAAAVGDKDAHAVAVVGLLAAPGQDRIERKPRHEVALAAHRRLQRLWQPQ